VNTTNCKLLIHKCCLTMLGGKGKDDLFAQLLGGKAGKGKCDLLSQLLSGKGGNLDFDAFSKLDPRAAENEKNQRVSQGSREERIAHHLETVKQCKAMEMQRGHGRRVVQSNTYSYERKTKTSSVDLNALEPITISELQVAQVHHGRVLYCRTITPCTFMQSAMTLVEDSAGDIAEIAVYNAPRVHRLQDAQRYLYKDRAIAIKEPFWKVRADGTLGIRIDDPDDLILDIDVPTPKPACVEDRLAQLIKENSNIGKKKLREMLQAEGFSVSQKRVQELLALLRGGGVEESQPSLQSHAEAEHTGEGTDSMPSSQGPLALPKRSSDTHQLLHSAPVHKFREAGNAAIKVGQYADADKAYTKAIKASARESAGMVDAEQQGDNAIAQEAEQGVALWTLFSNRAAARMRLDRPDEALQDALMAHYCAPPEAVKPVLRCAEALEALCQHAEVQSILQAAIQEFPLDEVALQQKQRDLAPKATLHVGVGQRYSSIMDAVLNAPAGAEILVSPGVYQEPLILSKPVTIRSIGAVEPDEHWVHGAPPGEIVQVWVKSLHAISANAQGSICLRGLRIVCEAPAERNLHAVEAWGGVVLLRNCSLSSTSGPILGADQGARVILEHCAVHDGGQGGLIAVNGACLVMSKVFCCRAAASGLELRVGGQAVLESCSFFANGRAGIIIWHGAGSFFAKGTEVHSNSFESGILIEENVARAVLKFCKVYGNGHAGVAVQTKGIALMQDCEVYSNLEGILLQSSGQGTIERCEVFKNRSNGIFVGYDHVGSAQIVGNKVHGNSKGILLGTGRSEKVIVQKNKEFNNNAPPCLEMPPHARSGARLPQREMDIREWSKNVKKSGGDIKKAALETGEQTFLDVLLASGFADDMTQNIANANLACAHCNKPPGSKKFQKCSVCLLVNYCSPACQQAHWKAGHKTECKPPAPRHPCFLDNNRSVDDVGDGKCTFQ